MRILCFSTPKTASLEAADRLVKTKNLVELSGPITARKTQWALNRIAREGNPRMRPAPSEPEAIGYIEKFWILTGRHGLESAVLTGHRVDRVLVTGVGTLAMKHPQIRDRSGQRCFTV